MKLLKKFFANIKNLNKLIQIVLTFCLCFVITFFLTLIFNNKFKFIEKFTHSSCENNDKYRIYWFYGDKESSEYDKFSGAWNELSKDTSLKELQVCYIKAPKKKKNDENDETYSKFLQLYPHAETAGNIVLFLGKNLSDSTNQQMNPVLNITHIKDYDYDEISNEIRSLITKYNNNNNNNSNNNNNNS